MEPKTNLRLLSISLFILTISITTIAVDPLIKKICDTTPHPDLCLTDIAPFVKGNPDKKNILQVSIQVSKKLAKEDIIVIKKLSEKPGTLPKVLSTLKFCTSTYENSVFGLDKALVAATGNDVSALVSYLGGVLVDGEDCEDSFRSIGVSSPLTNYMLKLRKMMDNCLTLAR